MGDEGQQLRKYVSESCEKAFAALVQKHAGMVFGTAYRRTGDREAAEEISQNVFTILARKARALRGDGSLGGWLHRTTLLETRNFLQQQRRLREKMQALSEHEHSQSEDPQAAQQALPILDEAIDKLPAGDRRLILLRFFEGLTIREIAVATGKSEAASQKQSQRALRKLSDLLKRRGVVVPAAILASQLVPETSKAATIELAASLSKAALAGASSITTTQLIANTILTMTYSKSIIATATGLSLAATAIVPMTLMGSPGDDEKKTAPAAKPTASAVSSAGPKRTPKTRVILPPGDGSLSISEDPFGGSSRRTGATSGGTLDSVAFLNAMKRRSTDIFFPLMKELELPEAKQKKFIELNANRHVELEKAGGNAAKREQINRDFDAKLKTFLGAEVFEKVKEFRAALRRTTGAAVPRASGTESISKPKE